MVRPAGPHDDDAATTRLRVVAVLRPGPDTAGAPGPLTPIDGIPLLVRAADALRAGRVIDVMLVAVAGNDVDAAHAALGDRADDVGPPERLPAALERCAVQGGRRPGGPGGDAVTVLLVHDPLRGLAPAALVGAVLDSARAGRVVTVPVLPLTDTVKVCDERRRVIASPDRAGLRVVQTPQAFRLDALDRTRRDAVLSAPAGPGWAAAGHPATTVPGDPAAACHRTHA